MHSTTVSKAAMGCRTHDECGSTGKIEDRQPGFGDQPAAFSSASSSALHEGAHTAWDLPSTFRVPIMERARCLPHIKHDMVAAPKDVVAANGDPDTLDL